MCGYCAAGRQCRIRGFLLYTYHTYIYIYLYIITFTLIFWNLQNWIDPRKISLTHSELCQPKLLFTPACRCRPEQLSTTMMFFLFFSLFFVYFWKGTKFLYTQSRIQRGAAVAVPFCRARTQNIKHTHIQIHI